MRVGVRDLDFFARGRFLFAQTVVILIRDKHQIAAKRLLTPAKIRVFEHECGRTQVQ
jgi:hypothetical protein